MNRKRAIVLRRFSKIYSNKSSVEQYPDVMRLLFVLRQLRYMKSRLVYLHKHL